MGWSEFFKFGGSSSPNSDDMPSLFPLSVNEKLFVETDVLNLYSKILTDVVERTEGLGDENVALLWDNCLASEKSDGLISMLSKAMVDKAELFLVYDPSTKVIRKATNEETNQIKADYKKQAESKVGVFISFKNYNRTDMLKLYSALEYCTIGALNKSMNVSKAVQIKVAELRAGVSLGDSAAAKAQGLAIAKGLQDGKDVMLDAKDIIDTATPKLDATNATMLLLNQKRSFYIGLPASYITGELNAGLGDSGQADAKAIDRGLKGYFVSIIKPVCKAIFGKELTFKSDDFQQLTSALEAMKTFELTSAEYMSDENKLKIVNKLFGLPETEKGGPKETTPAPADPAAGARDVTPPKKVEA